MKVDSGGQSLRWRTSQVACGCVAEVCKYSKCQVLEGERSLRPPDPLDIILLGPLMHLVIRRGQGNSATAFNHHHFYPAYPTNTTTKRPYHHPKTDLALSSLLPPSSPSHIFILQPILRLSPSPNTPRTRSLVLSSIPTRQPPANTPPPSLHLPRFLQRLFDPLQSYLVPSA